MDSTLIVIVLVVIIAAFVANSRGKKSTAKKPATAPAPGSWPGTQAEWRIYCKLNGKEIQGHSKTYHNLLVPKSGDIADTELDVVMLHEKGVFVFESKDYSGWIFGSADSKQWCQTFPNGEKNFFFNPVNQNWGHVKALAKHLGMDEDRIHSYIVFADGAEFKEAPAASNEFTFCQEKQLLTLLKRDMNNYWCAFGEKGFAQAAAQLDALQAVSTTEALAAHAAAVKEKHGE